MLFICDYVLKMQGKMILNPYGPGTTTQEGLAQLLGHMTDYPVSKVCGVDYVMDYPSWEKQVLPLTR
jgi:hypothetical protein